MKFKSMVLNSKLVKLCLFFLSLDLFVIYLIRGIQLFLYILNLRKAEKKNQAESIASKLSVPWNYLKYAVEMSMEITQNHHSENFTSG